MTIEHTWSCPKCEQQLGTIEGVGEKFWCPFCGEWLPAGDIVHTFKKETDEYTTYISAPFKYINIKTHDKKKIPRSKGE